jgi:hypothetical protein
MIGTTIGGHTHLRRRTTKGFPDEKYIDRIIIGVDADTQKGFEKHYLSEVDWIRS